jgi:hypothetical protein
VKNGIETARRLTVMRAVNLQNLLTCQTSAPRVLLIPCEEERVRVVEKPPLHHRVGDYIVWQHCNLKWDSILDVGMGMGQGSKDLDVEVVLHCHENYVDVVARHLKRLVGRDYLKLDQLAQSIFSSLCLSRPL